jgi:Fe-S-cluster containining protein
LIPKDSNGNEIWKKRDEIRVSENHPETVKLEIYDCLRYNPNTGLCNNYEKRPHVCQTTTCINVNNAEKSLDEQHKELTEECFIKCNIKL